MKEFFKYVKEFPFKNVFALYLVYKLLNILEGNSSLRDILIVLLTLIIKHYFDSNTGAEKRDVTISKALDKANNTGIQNVDELNTQNLNVKK